MPNALLINGMLKSYAGFGTRDNGWLAGGRAELTVFSWSKELEISRNFLSYLVLIQRNLFHHNPCELYSYDMSEWSLSRTDRPSPTRITNKKHLNFSYKLSLSSSNLNSRATASNKIMFKSNDL